MENDHYLFNACSKNAKTGPIPVSYSPSKTCPDACSLKGGNGCYAEVGHTAIHWKKIDNRKWGMVWAEFVSNVRKNCRNRLWRHNIVGDLAGENNSIDQLKLAELVNANKAVKGKGFTYTHKPVGIVGEAASNARGIQWANLNGFTINLSADTLEEADEKAALGIGPVVVVLPSDAPRVSKTPAGRTVLACPAEDNKQITCSNCGACANANRQKIIGFRAHGSRKAKINKRHLSVV